MFDWPFFLGWTRTMSTKAKLTRCEVSKARLIYPSRLMSLIALGSFWLATRRIRTMLWQEGTSWWSYLFSAEREIEKKDIKVSTPLQEDWLLSTSSFSSSDSSYTTITFGIEVSLFPWKWIELEDWSQLSLSPALLQFTKISSRKLQGVDQEMLPQSKKQFGTNAVNGGGSGCSGDSFLVRILALTLSHSLIPYSLSSKPGLKEGMNQKITEK